MPDPGIAIIASSSVYKDNFGFRFFLKVKTVSLLMKSLIFFTSGGGWISESELNPDLSSLWGSSVIRLTIVWNSLKNWMELMSLGCCYSEWKISQVQTTDFLEHLRCFKSVKILQTLSEYFRLFCHYQVKMLKDAIFEFEFFFISYLFISQTLWQCQTTCSIWMIVFVRILCRDTSIL